MLETPLVTVLLPVYNCEKYIYEAINSVLNQSFTNFELLIIDDCSTDATVAIVREFTDKRICFYQKKVNSGYTDSLNFGISIAKGKYIARMDADDICLPERFAKQVEFLDKNPNIILCGTAINYIGTAEGNLFYPEKHNEIYIHLFCFLPAFAHPTVMGKREIFEKNNYNKNFEPAEDYELWTRIISQGEVANLNEILLKYRVHPNQVSVSKKHTQDVYSFKSRLPMVQALQLDSKYSEEVIFKFLISKNSLCTIHECEAINEFYNFVIQQNNKLEIFDKNLFNKKITAIKISLFNQYFNRKRILQPKSFLFLLRKITKHEFIVLLKMKYNG